MGKALIIKGANFTSNKVETITIGDAVPCTVLSLSESTISFTLIGQTETLVAEKTPANTTDELAWSSSNEDVATVSNGVVTCVGIGSATITATCGTQTATCSVTAIVQYVLDDMYHAENGATYSGSMELPTKNHIGRSSQTKARLYYSTEAYGTYRAFVLTQYAGQYLIPLPKGATKVTVTPPDGLKSYMYFILGNADEKQTYVSGADGESALGIYPGTFPSATVYPKEIDISEYADSANGFVMALYTPAGGDASTVSGKTSILFT